MTTTTENIIATAKAFGIKAKVWSKAGRLRIYADTGRKDMAVYLELDGFPDEVTGAAFKVFCNADQHPNWIKSQVEEHKKAFLPLMFAYIVENYRETPDPAAAGYGPDICGMIAEARAFEASRELNDA